MTYDFTFDPQKYKYPIDLEFLKDNGYIKKIVDSIVFVKGIENAGMYELVKINDNYSGIVLELGTELAAVGLLENNHNIVEGMPVRLEKKEVGIRLPQKFGGMVLNVLGEPQYHTQKDEQPYISMDKIQPLFNSASPIIDIAPVTRSFETGTALIDSVIPIGKGQRQLIVGDRQTGKTQLTINAIINQKGRDVACIYCGIGQKTVQIMNVVKLLKEAGAYDYTTIVASNAGDSIINQYLAPYAAAALAEYLRDQGKDVVVVYDDLSKHADAYRTLSLLFGRTPGREAYPGDTFYIHSSLLERAGQLQETKGGGSITALPIIETLSDDVTSYIPSNVISITDGQLFLKSSLFLSGQKPAIDVGISVSRVGGNAQCHLIRNLSRGLSLILSQYEEIKELLVFNSDLNEKDIKVYKKGVLLLELFKQDVHQLYSLPELAMLLFAVKNDCLLEVDIKLIPKLREFLSINAKEQEDIWQMLNKSLNDSDFSKANSKLLTQFIAKTKEKFLC